MTPPHCSQIATSRRSQGRSARRNRLSVAPLPRAGRFAPVRPGALRRATRSFFSTTLAPASALSPGSHVRPCYLPDISLTAFTLASLPASAPRDPTTTSVLLPHLPPS